MHPAWTLWTHPAYALWIHPAYALWIHPAYAHENHPVYVLKTYPAYTLPTHPAYALFQSWRSKLHHYSQYIFIRDSYMFIKELFYTCKHQGSIPPYTCNILNQIKLKHSSQNHIQTSSNNFVASISVQREVRYLGSVPLSQNSLSFAAYALSFSVSVPLSLLHGFLQDFTTKL